MMYHAESFAKLHFETFLIGYEGLSISTLARSCQNWQFQAPNQCLRYCVSHMSTFYTFRSCLHLLENYHLSSLRP